MLKIKWFKYTNLKGLILSLILGGAMATHAFAEDSSVEALLQDHAGDKRPILIFGADIDDKAVAQISALWSQRAELAERDILIVRVQARQVVVQRAGRNDDGRSRDVETYTEPALANAFRERFDVPSDDFAVILIGKDGEVKRRSDMVLDASDIFSQIDGMPMRQIEMSRSDTDKSE
ncbi:DUF4174 domain-containing protein [Allohahella marinimesophila]|uniref:DUF4174 domain-containing protein n=1 Tax=Allohahella marinimesophila TaxID=1054972 RepID=A0ABP7PMD3_9GAMM